MNLPSAHNVFSMLLCVCNFVFVCVHNNCIELNADDPHVYHHYYHHYDYYYNQACV